MTTTSPHISPHALAGEIKRRGREAGFDLVGIGPAHPSHYRDYLRRWLDDGRAGTMEWLGRRFDERTDPAAYLPGAQSVVCVAVNYHVPLDPVPEGERPFHGRIARYAFGDDYHDVLTRRLHPLADWLREQVPGCGTKVGVDTAPISEKELAARAGLGWVGKNTCLINPHAGSWLLLGEIITTLALPPDDPAIDRCGTCTRCIDACPTGAITAPYEMDARRCISYLTIEHRGPLSADQSVGIGQYLYGCDICQDVCPWNRKAQAAASPQWQPRFALGTFDARQVLEWTAADYAGALKGSAMKRVKLPVLQRNARAVLENGGMT